MCIHKQNTAYMDCWYIYMSEPIGKGIRFQWLLLPLTNLTVKVSHNIRQHVSKP